MIVAARHDGVREGAWRWPSFSPREMACRGSGFLRIDEKFMDRLQALRWTLATPLPVSSGYRSPEHNEQVSSTGRNGPHVQGRAADILAHGELAYAILRLAPQLGFTGIGVNQKGPHGERFIHLDDLPNETGRPRSWVWSY